MIKDKIDEPPVSPPQTPNHQMLQIMDRMLDVERVNNNKKINEIVEHQIEGLIMSGIPNTEGEMLAIEDKVRNIEKTLKESQESTKENLLMIEDAVRNTQNLNQNIHEYVGSEDIGNMFNSVQPVHPRAGRPNGPMRQPRNSLDFEGENQFGSLGFDIGDDDFYQPPAPAMPQPAMPQPAPAMPQPAMPMGEEDVMRREQEEQDRNMGYVDPASGLEAARQDRMARRQTGTLPEEIQSEKQNGSIYTVERLREMGEEALRNPPPPLQRRNGTKRDPRFVKMNFSFAEEDKYWASLEEHPRGPLLDTINGPYTGLDPREVPNLHIYMAKGGDIFKNLPREAKDLWDGMLNMADQEGKSTDIEYKDEKGNKYFEPGIEYPRYFLKLMSSYRYHPTVVQLLAKMNLSSCPESFHPVPYMRKVKQEHGDCYKFHGIINSGDFLKMKDGKEYITKLGFNTMISKIEGSHWYELHNQSGGKTLKKKKRRKKSKTKKQKGGNNKKYTKKGGCSKRKKQKGGKCKTFKKQKGGKYNKTLKKK